ncbi:EAL domain-containing protein [Photobacterium toruni]|uniref:EAL domain-containing protein n=1 Tax=Photobacterium toruni TaxID=1935446 RepID=UPI00210FB5E0|nr:EAL domain-containing protein [Photobacterium toruni]
MVLQKFKLYEELTARIDKGKEFYLVIVDVIDAHLHKDILGDLVFTSVMNDVALWVLQLAHKSMKNKNIMAFEYGYSQIALICSGQTNPHIRAKFQTLLEYGYCHSTTTISHLFNVSYKVAIFNEQSDISAQELLEDVEPPKPCNSTDEEFNSEKYTFSKLDLLNAMKNNELELWFQTKVDLKTNKEMGVESLLRWRHPDYGVLSPVDFLYWFKFYTLQCDLDKWVITTAFNHSQTWVAKGEMTQIAVNIDGSSLNQRHCNLVDFIRESAAIFKIRPELIEFEIVETQVIEKNSKIHYALMDISSQGFSIAIDDFGTGTSNINYLMYLPINTIKLDRFFCTNLNYQDLDIRSILKLESRKSIPRVIIKKALAAHKSMNQTSLSTLTRSTVDLLLCTDHKIVAEGIETHEQAVIMHSLGCDIGQGYYFGYPEPRIRG